jgi:hypothetical protein
MIISGGYVEKTFLNDVYSFDLETFKWYEIENLNERKNIYHHKSIIFQDGIKFFLILKNNLFK